MTRHSDSRVRSATRVWILALAAGVTVALSGCGGVASASNTGAETAAVTPSASPSNPVAVADIAEGDQEDPVLVNVSGPVQVNFREITLRPGGGTGQHCHYGNLIAVVKAGTLTHYAPIYPGGVREYAQGESILEGSGYVHEGKNEGSEDVVLWVTYVTPEGKPLAETELSHCDH